MRVSLVALAAAVVCLYTASGAAAKIGPPGTVAIIPSGNSAVNQYVENVPGARGNVPTLTIHSHGSSGAVAPSTQRALGSQGADGLRAARLANATAPAGLHGLGHNSRRGGHGAQGGGTASGGTGGGAGSGGPTGTPVSGSVVSPTSAVLKAVTGSATHGLGALLPAILVITAIGAGLLAALRRRQAQ